MSASAQPVSADPHDAGFFGNFNFEDFKSSALEVMGINESSTEEAKTKARAESGRRANVVAAVGGASTLQIPNLAVQAADGSTGLISSNMSDVSSGTLGTVLPAWGYT
eukprot:Lankesteria_metandrocarpae@DN3620_c0_g1_i1.p1